MNSSRGFTVIEVAVAVAIAALVVVAAAFSYSGYRSWSESTAAALSSHNAEVSAAVAGDSLRYRLEARRAAVVVTLRSGSLALEDEAQAARELGRIQAALDALNE